MAQPVVEQYLATDEAGAGRHPVPHGVDDELGPAFTPEILRDLGRVRERKQAADVPGTVGHQAVHLADAEHGMAGAMFAPGPADVARLAKFDRDGARDRAQRLPPADDAGDGLLIHAVLQRDDEAAGCEVLPDHRRRPGRVVGLGADEGDVDRPLLGEALQLGHVQGTRRRRELGHVAQVADAQARCPYRLDVLRPEVDEGHVLAGLCHMGAGIAADCARADNRNPGSHSSFSAFVADPPYTR